MAHGFLVLSEHADFLYKTTAYYAPEAERCIAWNDPGDRHAWPDVGSAPQLSARDAAAPVWPRTPRRRRASALQAAPGRWAWPFARHSQSSGLSVSGLNAWT